LSIHLLPPESQDPQTGLHNRRSFLALLRRQIQQANDRQHKLALLVLDIDGFARINGAHGFDFGDKLLQHMGRQLMKVARKQDYAARIGSDRFALVLPRVMNAGHAELAVQKLYRLLDMPFQCDDKRLRMGVTIGVALCPMNATHAEFLLRHAEKALDTARLRGQRSAFSPEGLPTEGIAQFWDIELELDAALERGELSMHYQPKVRVSDLRPVGSEALMRWISPSRGFVPPDVFIPVAEQTGQIKKLTVWALNTALRQSAKWKHPWGPLSLSVNVPPELVAQHDLPDVVENAIKLWGDDHTQLMLEITERSLMDSGHSFAILSRIRELGVQVSIDDFGTGYSCLAYFKDIPVDELKIDRSFVSGLLTEPASAHVTGLIIDMAHRFGLSVAAEGVEDVATLEILQRSTCDTAQGYLCSKALPSPDMERWLASWPERAVQAWPGALGAGA
jgi:diguanylate cyclase (GGDEF)-like protein